MKSKTSRSGFLSLFVVAACGTDADPAGPPDSDASTSVGGQQAGGAIGSGGTSATAGTPGAGGVAASGGEAGSGGTSGSTAGGSGGVSGSAGAGGSGGTASGGSSGIGAGGTASGGSAGSEQFCDLPTTFEWRSSGPLIAPKSAPGHDFVSIKDPSVVYWNGRFHIHATVFDRTVSGWNMVYLNFTDWSQADAASQFYMQNSPTRGGVAPQLFYFTPTQKWVLVYQWGAVYSTSDDPSRPELWTPRASLLNNAPEGALDFWVICDSDNCYLFFSNDRGQLYQAKMPIDQFPSAFDNAQIIMSDTAANLFEASNVYRIRGTNKYLLLVEAYGPRYFRSWTSTSLDGPWTPLAATQQNPFAGLANVTFDGAEWTDDISHGDMVRDNPDETMTIDACDMQFVYQGADPNANTGGDYGLIPYRLGLLTLVR